MLKFPWTDVFNLNSFHSCLWCEAANILLLTFDFFFFLQFNWLYWVVLISIVIANLFLYLLNICKSEVLFLMLLLILLITLQVCYYQCWLLYEETKRLVSKRAENFNKLCGLQRPIFLSSPFSNAFSVASGLHLFSENNSCWERTRVWTTRSEHKPWSFREAEIL